jgi:hypothetical protein
MRDIIISKNIWICLIVATSVLTVLIEVFSLLHGISDIFPYFFLIPMALVVYVFPKKGILFTVGLGWLYIIMVYALGTSSTRVIAVYTAWFFVYVSLGIITSSAVISFRDKAEQVEELRTKAFGQIENNIQQFEILNDEIRNPLQGILFDLCEMTGNLEHKKDVLKKVHDIDKILDKMDKCNMDSKKVREYLQKHYDFKN